MTWGPDVRATKYRWWARLAYGGPLRCDEDQLRLSEALDCMEHFKFQLWSRYGLGGQR